MTRPLPASMPHVCFVIHSHRPYCFDFDEILALPEGFRYRNRFDVQWLEAQLRQDVSSLVGRQVLIVLRDIENNRLIPVRWGNLFSAQMVGKIAFFEYHLAEFVSYSSPANVSLQEIIDRTGQFELSHSWLPGTAGMTLDGPSVFLSSTGSNLPVAPASDLGAWGNAVSAVATAPIFSRIEFLKIVDLSALLVHLGRESSPHVLARCRAGALRRHSKYRHNSIRRYPGRTVADSGRNLAVVAVEV